MEFLKVTATLNNIKLILRAWFLFVISNCISKKKNMKMVRKENEKTEYIKINSY